MEKKREGVDFIQVLLGAMILAIIILIGLIIWGTFHKTLSPQSSSLNQDSMTNIFYIQSTANIRSCSSTSCDSFGTYDINTELPLPYASVNDLPEWVEFSFPDDKGVNQTGYINKINLGESKVAESEKANNQVSLAKGGYQVCKNMNATWDGTSYTSSGGFSCTCNTGYTPGADGKPCVLAPRTTNTVSDYNNCLATAKADYLGSWATACSNSYSAYTQCYQQYGDLKDYCKQTYGGWQNSPTCTLTGGSAISINNSYEADKNRCATVYGHI